MRRLLVALLLLLPLAAAASAAAPPVPSANDKCPVCGMFVSKYPDWTASATFRDGTTRFFDGAKDLFSFLLHPDRYGSRHGMRDAVSLYVKDYYRLEPVDAQKAYYVVGSDVLGPMGKELVPFRTREEALDFLRDHGGASLVSFREVNDALLKTLE